VQLAELPRMADFARVLAAIDGVLGWDSLAAYSRVADEVTESVVESDPFAEAVRSVALTGWRGTSTKLLAKVTPEGQRLPKGWPASARAVSGTLRRLVPALRATGVEVTFELVGHSRARTILLGPLEGHGERPSAPSAPSADLRDHADGRADANQDADANTLPGADGADANGAADGGSHFLSVPVRCCIGCGKRLDAALTEAGERFHPTCEAGAA